MIRIFVLALAGLMLTAALALAQPGIQVEYFSGIPQITLEGNYATSRYTVQRSFSESGPFTPISHVNLLCLGSCFVDDYSAVPGQTYWYRFDILPASGPSVRHGPYPVTIAAPYPGAVHTRVFPNPSSGPARIEVYLLGAASDAPLEARATLIDLQGRKVRSIFQAPLRRGITTIAWDGRDDRGALLPAGQYFLRLASPLGTSIQRVLRTR